MKPPSTPPWLSSSTIHFFYLQKKSVKIIFNSMSLLWDVYINFFKLSNIKNCENPVTTKPKMKNPETTTTKETFRSAFFFVFWFRSGFIFVWFYWVCIKLDFNLWVKVMEDKEEKMGLEAYIENQSYQHF
jgi:hypothetical protein